MQTGLITIKKAAKMLGVSIMTLRRWDKNGKFPSIRPGGEKTFRLYRLQDIEALTTNLVIIAKQWVSEPKGKEVENELYCQNSSIFQARLQKMESEMIKMPELKDIFSLISSTSGE